MIKRIALIVALLFACDARGAPAAARPVLDQCLDPPSSGSSQDQVTACDKALKEAASDDPAARERILLARGRALDDLERFGRAEADGDAALKLAPNDPAALILRGEARSFADKNDEAMADFDAALKLRPGDARALMRRGQIYQYNRADPIKARQDYDAAIKSDPKLMLAWYYRGLLRSDAHDYPGAHADFIVADKLSDDEPYIGRTLGASYEDLDQRPKALEVYDRILRAHPDDAETLTYRASARLDDGNLLGAIADADGAIAKRSDLPRPYRLKAMALDKQGKTTDAIASAEEGLKHKRDYGPILSDLGGYYKKARQYQLALASLDAAVKSDPKNVDYLVDRAGALSQLDDDDKAAADYDNAIKLDPKSAYAFSERGRFHLGRGEYDAAIADFDKTLELDPKYDSSIFNRALAFQDLQQYDRAIREYDRYLALDPNDADTFSNKGECYRLLGDDLLAIQNLELAIKADPKLALAWWRLNLARADSGDTAGALEAKTEALRLDPHVGD